MHLFRRKEPIKTSHANLHTKSNMYICQRLEEKIICIAYIPSNHEGSLTSSMENRAFNSGVHINFRRGAEGEGAYFLPTGYITCTDQEKTHKTIAVVTQHKKEREREKMGQKEGNKKNSRETSNTRIAEEISNL